eukprot:TRINITY_DN2002_c0_g1_i1.p1 TRINITY_DN2002_c0_g1~~TRINITY_DN2002_c0_g1_i1.p1  ORF type:complete len:180 (-),score=23.14 TRINITY_DN2002_c0_g1_i1:293-832(-)
MKTLHTLLVDGKKKLETYPFDFTSTESILSSVTLLQELNAKGKTWKPECETQKTIEQVLTRQRYAFPEDWLWSDKITQELRSFRVLLDKKLVLMYNEGKAIQEKISRESHNLNKQVAEYAKSWELSKLTDGEMEFEEVKKGLSEFLDRLNVINEKVIRMEKAKIALGMPCTKETRLKAY